MRNGTDSGSAEGWKLVARGRSTYLCREATRFCHHTLADIISRFFSPAADPGETSRRTQKNKAKPKSSPPTSPYCQCPTNGGGL